MNKQPWMTRYFQWQQGFGAFSYGRSQLDRVVAYIHNQEQHHMKQTFREEYIALLETFEIPFDERYLFDFIAIG